MAERKSLFERITSPFRRREQTKVTIVEEPLKTKEQLITEAINLLDDKKVEEAKDLIRNIETTQTQALFKTELASSMTEEKLFDVYRQMDNDSIISSALDLFADNATQVNTKTGHVISVESSDKVFQDEINAFLWDIANVDTEAWNYARAIAMYGKVILDTKASNGGREWSFLEVDKPEYVLPLTYGQDNIRFHAVVKDPSDTLDTHSFYSAYQQVDKNKSLESYIADADRYIAGFNARKHLGKMVVETTHPITRQPEREELYIRGGKSYLEGVVETWKMLSTLEDSMFVSRLVKSKAFNLVTIDVSDANTKQSNEMIASVKRSLRGAETIDKTAERYSNRTSPIPANDFVYVPKKGEKGAVTIEQVGGEVGAQDLADIEYLRNKLFAGLGILKAYLGFEETTPGGLGDTTLTMLDERFTRKVKRLRQSLAFVYKQIVDYYWVNSSVSRTDDNLPEYKILLGKLSTREEEANRNELLENFNVANELLNLTSAFPDKVDEDKLFDYIFNTVLGIDTKHFDNITEIKNVKVTPHQLDEKELTKPLIEAIDKTQRTILEHNIRRRIPKRQKMNESFPVIVGTKAELLMQKPIEEILREYDIFLEDKGKIISLHSALDNKDLRQSLTEATYKDLKNRTKVTDPVRIQKSKKITGRYLGLDDNNFIVFRMSAEDPEKNRGEGRQTSYETKVHLKALIDVIESRRAGETDMNIVRKAVEDDLAVSCECPASKYWGQQYNGTKEGYSIVQNHIEPTRNKQYQTICKHIATTLTLLPFWSNTIVRDLRAKGLLTPTSQAKKDKVEVEDDKKVSKVDNKEVEITEPTEKTKTREEKLADKAPKTKKKTKQVEQDETEVEKGVEPDEQ